MDIVLQSELDNVLTECVTSLGLSMVVSRNLFVETPVGKMFSRNLDTIKIVKSFLKCLVMKNSILKPSLEIFLHFNNIF